jgi:hypothetical protein
MVCFEERQRKESYLSVFPFYVDRELGLENIH